MIARAPMTAPATESSIGRRWRPPVASPSISAARPTPSRTKPATSSGGRSGSRVFSKKRLGGTKPGSPLGVVVKKKPRPAEKGVEKPPGGGAGHRPPPGRGGG